MSDPTPVPIYCFHCDVKLEDTFFSAVFTLKKRTEMLARGTTLENLNLCVQCAKLIMPVRPPKIEERRNELGL